MILTFLKKRLTRRPPATCRILYCNWILFPPGRASRRTIPTAQAARLPFARSVRVTTAAIGGRIVVARAALAVQVVEWAGRASVPAKLGSVRRLGVEPEGVIRESAVIREADRSRVAMPRLPVSTCRWKFPLFLNASS